MYKNKINSLKNKNKVVYFGSLFIIAIIVIVATYSVFNFIQRFVNYEELVRVVLPKDSNKSFVKQKQQQLEGKIMLWDFSFARDVNYSTGLPNFRNNMFFIDDTDNIFAWLRFTADNFFINKVHNIKFEWYNSKGLLVSESIQSSKLPKDANDWWNYYFVTDSIMFNKLSTNNNENLLGTWKLKVYIDKDIAFDQPFYLVQRLNKKKYLDDAKNFKITSLLGNLQIVESNNQELKYKNLSNFSDIKIGDDILLDKYSNKDIFDDSSIADSLLISNDKGVALKLLGSDGKEFQQARLKLLSLDFDSNLKPVLKVELYSGSIIVLDGTLKVINHNNKEEEILRGGNTANSFKAIGLDKDTKKFQYWQSDTL